MNVDFYLGLFVVGIAGIALGCILSAIAVVLVKNVAMIDT